MGYYDLPEGYGVCDGQDEESEEIETSREQEIISMMFPEGCDEKLRDYIKSLIREDGEG